MAGISADISERKRAEEALRESEEKFKRVFDSNMVGVAFWSADGSLTDANQAFCDLIGYAPEEVRAGNVRWSDVTPPEMLERDRQGIEEINATGVCTPYEKVFIHRDGHRRTIIVGGAMLGGKRDEGVAFAVNITERKQAEEQVRRRAEELQGLLEAVPAAVWISYDPKCEVIEGNREANRFYEAAEGENVSATTRPEPRRFFTPEGRELAASELPMQAAAANREVRDSELHVLLPSGRRMAMVGSAVPLRDEKGQVRGCIGAFLDITARKEAERVLTRDKAELQRLVAERTAKLQELVGELEHFSYTITHDMRSPLRAMRGYSEIVNLACEDCERKEPKEFLRKITTAAGRMDRLITDALSYSQSVRQELPVEEVDSGALLRGMLDTYPELQQSKAHIRVEGKLPVVLGNEAGLTQVFSNLLGNAVKFVKPGEMPEIRVWAETVQSPRSKVQSPESRVQSREGDGEKWVRIWVEDKGIGISKEMLPRVFDMFSRASKDYDGTGIGLALVRKVMQRMGGRVGVESEVGKGSRFWVDLKAVERRVWSAE